MGGRGLKPFRKASRSRSFGNGICEQATFSSEHVAIFFLVSEIIPSIFVIAREASRSIENLLFTPGKRRRRSAAALRPTKKPRTALLSTFFNTFGRISEQGNTPSPWQRATSMSSVSLEHITAVSLSRSVYTPPVQSPCSSLNCSTGTEYKVVPAENNSGGAGPSGEPSRRRISFRYGAPNNSTFSLERLKIEKSRSSCPTSMASLHIPTTSRTRSAAISRGLSLWSVSAKSARDGNSIASSADSIVIKSLLETLTTTSPFSSLSSTTASVAPD